MPLSVAVALVRCGSQILLIRRARGSYVGWWALPGGKIETGEHVSAAARREVREEAGLETRFERHLGVVSEHLRENGELNQHFLLHVCALSAASRSVTASEEGALRWVGVSEAAETLERVVPSDRAIIQRLFAKNETGYHECVLEKDGDAYRLHSFD